jgi:hypothetical protein
VKVGDLVMIRAYSELWQQPQLWCGVHPTILMIVPRVSDFKSIPKREFKVVHITGTAIGTIWYVDEKEIIPLKDTL